MSNVDGSEYSFPPRLRSDEAAIRQASGRCVDVKASHPVCKRTHLRYIGFVPLYSRGAREGAHW